MPVLVTAKTKLAFIFINTLVIIATTVVAANIRLYWLRSVLDFCFGFSFRPSVNLMFMHFCNLFITIRKSYFCLNSFILEQLYTNYFLKTGSFMPFITCNISAESSTLLREHNCFIFKKYSSMYSFSLIFRFDNNTWSSAELHV